MRQCIINEPQPNLAKIIFERKLTWNLDAGSSGTIHTPSFKSDTYKSLDKMI